MPTSYHRFAGSSLERLSALSDGVFAVAMTLLVLDLKAPALGAHGSGHALAHDLLHNVAPRLLPYAMSFLTLGIFWVGSKPSSASSPAATAISPGSTWSSCSASR